MASLASGPRSRCPARRWLTLDDHLVLGLRRVIDRVGRLIRGFETPYRMELLATVHWVASHEGARSPAEARELVQHWNERKKARYQGRHIENAWQRLESEG